MYQVESLHDNLIVAEGCFRKGDVFWIRQLDRTRQLVESGNVKLVGGEPGKFAPGGATVRQGEAGWTEVKKLSDGQASGQSIDSQKSTENSGEAAQLSASQEDPA